MYEVSKTFLLDDLGRKRALYEDLNVSECSVVDVQNIQVLAYAVGEAGSWRVQTSQVLPGLAIATLEEALQYSQEVDQSQIGNWLLTQFQNLG